MAAGAVQMLQKSLLDAQKDLSSTDDAIKRLIGRDPNIRPPRRASGPGPGPDREPSDGGRMRAWSGSYDGPPPAKRREDGPPPAKRKEFEGGRSRLFGRLGPPPSREGGPRRGEPGIFLRSRLAGRLGPPPGEEDSEGEQPEEERPRKKPVLQSSVIATKAPPRPTVTDGDEDSKKRNRRMFGFLMGTLQKFKAAEETAKTSDKERRRQEIANKVEQIQEIEKEEAVRARKELFEQRKQQKYKIAQLAGQVATVSMYEEWTNYDKQLVGYIKTRAKPAIFYKPAELTPRTEKKLSETTAVIEEKIKKRQEEVESLVGSSGEDPKNEKEAAGKEEEEERPKEGEQMDMDEGGGERGRANSNSGEEPL